MKRIFAGLAFALATCSVLAGSLAVKVDASAPKWDSGALVSSNVLVNVWVQVYGAKQGATKTLLDAAKWAPTLTFRRPDNSDTTQVHCYAVRYAIDVDGDGKITEFGADKVGPFSSEVCGRFADPVPVLNLTAPPAPTIEAPAT
jgi:hypothetical protein